MGRQLGEELPLGDTDTSLHLTPTNMQMNTLVMAVFAILFALLLVTTAHPAPDPDALASPVADPHRRRVRPYRRPSYSSHHGGGFGGLGGFGSSYQVGHRPHAHQVTTYDRYGGHSHHTIVHDHH